MTELAAAAERAEQLFGMRQCPEQRLGAADLALGGVGVALQPERQGMCVAVVSDPVTLGMGALSNDATLLLFEFLPDHKERRAHAPPRQDVEHHRGHLGLRPIVEAEGKIGHGLVSIPDKSGGRHRCG